MAQDKTPRNTVSTGSGFRSSGATATAVRPAAPRTQQTTVTPKAATITHEQIAQRAREIWVKRGRVPGQDEKNWLEAEAQLKAELARK